MFYFTCNESKIYESFTFWNKLQEKINFYDILIYWDAPVHYERHANHNSKFITGSYILYSNFIK